MKTQRIASESGYLLHTRPYRETSLLIEVFTQHHGRVSMVAKGARGKQNALQLFTHYDFSWMGKSDLYTMIKAESQGITLLSPYQLCCGLYINELLLRALGKEDPHPEIYESYKNLLAQLNGPNNIQISLRIFERNLLQNLGYGLSFENVEENKFYFFQPSQGFVEVSENTKESLSGKSLLAFSQNKLEEKYFSEIKYLMRMALSPLIGEKPLKTRELFI